MIRRDDLALDVSINGFNGLSNRFSHGARRLCGRQPRKFHGAISGVKSE